ncbi:MAG: O-antigen ligase family protein, partial [Bacteroidales bacterium]|nr:O-antigen ligase family protein [Bacteroidales bacterium]
MWLLTAALITSLFSKKICSSLSTTDLFAALFFVYLTINHLFLSPINAWGRYLILLLLAMNFLSLRVILPAYRHIGKLALFIFFLCGLREAHIGILQLLGMSASYHPRFAMTGTFFNPGPYGGYLSVAMSVALYYIVHYYYYFMRCMRRILSRQMWIILRPVIWLYPLSVATFALSFIIFFGIMSRGAMVALGISAALIFWHKKSFRVKVVKMVKTHRKKATLCALLLLIMAGGTGTALYSVKKGSADSRLLMWRISCNMIVGRPLNGYGYGTYLGEYAQAQAAYFRKHPDSAAIEAAGAPEFGFNGYLQIGAETGVTGLLLFLLAIVSALIRLVKKRDPLA